MYDQDYLIFYYIDENNITTTLNMETTFITIQKLDCIRYVTYDQLCINNFNDFLSFLNNMEKINVCRGVTPFKQRRHQLCSLFFDVDDLHDMRCRFCRFGIKKEDEIFNDLKDNIQRLTQPLEIAKDKVKEVKRIIQEFCYLLLSKKKSEYNASATYTFADLMRDLITSVLPKRWCFIKLPNQIVFYHNNNKVTTTVIVNSSMGIIIQRFDIIKKIRTSDTSFEDFEDFKRCLDIIQRMKICKGFYNQYKKRHLDCYRIMLNMQEFSSTSIRCPYCRKLKIAIIKRLQTNTRLKRFNANTKHRIHRMKSILTHFKKQINFIKNLLESMKEKLKKKLSYHLTSSKENMLDTKN
ncbi:hypothetical protein HN011_003951 [Eciton burchellii]|nr:hypothetical protein HN011_003951 [Eciton burchellii]